MDIKRGFVVSLQLCIAGLLPFIHQVDSQLNASNCPNNWERAFFGNKFTCLWLSHIKASWIDAMQWCKVMDGQLVEFKSRTFNTKLASMIQLKHSHKGPHWIGLSDMESELEYKWMTSKTYASSLMNSFFKPGQRLSGRDKNCVSMNEMGEWTVDPCKNEYWFFCQKVPQQQQSNKIV